MNQRGGSFIELVVVAFVVGVVWVAFFKLNKPTAPEGTYDLAPRSLHWSPNPVKAGDEVLFTYSIQNMGSDTVPRNTYDVEFYIDGNKISLGYETPMLPREELVPFESSKKNFHFKPLQAGKHNYRLVVDPQDRLKEFNESNNVISGEFVVE